MGNRYYFVGFRHTGVDSWTSSNGEVCHTEDPRFHWHEGEPNSNGGVMEARLTLNDIPADQTSRSLTHV